MLKRMLEEYYEKKLDSDSIKVWHGYRVNRKSITIGRNRPIKPRIKCRYCKTIRTTVHKAVAISRKKSSAREYNEIVVAGSNGSTADALEKNKKRRKYYE